MMKGFGSILTYIWILQSKRQINWKFHLIFVILLEHFNYNTYMNALKLKLKTQGL